MKIKILPGTKNIRLWCCLCILCMYQLPTGIAGSYGIVEKIELEEAFLQIGQEYGVFFNYDRALVSHIMVEYERGRYNKVQLALKAVFDQTQLEYQIIDGQYIAVYQESKQGINSMKKMIEHFQNIVKETEGHQRSNLRTVKPLSHKSAKEVVYKRLVFSVSGTVTDAEGNPLIGVNIQVSGTNEGTATDIDGHFILDDIDENAVLVVSYIGYQTQELAVAGKTSLIITLLSDSQLLDEVVVIGYGTQKKSDLTGSVVHVDNEILSERPNTSIIQSLHGAVPGMNIGQVNRAGEEPSLSIRGRTSLAGAQNPLIVLDGVIFRGNIIDINPGDIKSIDVLKDASSAAIYGSQASNGVMIITTKDGGMTEKPTINFSMNYSFQQPTQRFTPETPAEHLERIESAYFFNSRTEESGYLTPNPDWEVSSTFRTGDQLRAYENGIITDWYNITTNDQMHMQNHNLSLSKRTENSGYFVSVGYTDQAGYMKNEDYSRWNARINVDNTITDWLEIGIQSFMTSSDYSGYDLNPTNRYSNRWYSPAYNEDGSFVESPRGVGVGNYNPYYFLASDDLDKRLNLFGNTYADIKLPFIKGLSFKTNFNLNRLSTSQYYYRSFANNFLGIGSKTEGIRTEWTNDNILTYKSSFNNIHNLNITLLYGREKRNFRSTGAEATDFVSDELGFNRLQAGNSELQGAHSSAWSESSLYNMARVFYGYRNKYLFTGTVRRDGFSGFSEANKFGIFPSASLAWLISEESFFKSAIPSIDFFKIRVSYGANGNRTISRYQTLARVGGGFDYINGQKVPAYSQSITDLASPNLKWETTTGLNLGVDFVLTNQRLNGSIDYYNNNTTDILYNVDIPGISRFETFPDNLGKMHNHGLDLSLSSVNIRNNQFEWTTQFVFSRNRNELKELLGFDNDGDGIEDDLVSEGLFIGEPLSAIYTYSTDGELWQLDEDIPATADVGSYKIKDINGDGVINPGDRVIVGYSAPAYRFSINNRLNYKSWTLSIFINSVQGNDKFYKGEDRLFGFTSPNDFLWDNTGFPADLDFWLPENPNAKYERLGARYSGGLGSSLYTSRSFIRLQDVNLSYDIDFEFLSRISINRLSLFFNGKNLLIFSKWPGWDPETGQGLSTSGRPVLRNFSFGLNIDL